MNKKTTILIGILAIFIVGMTIGVASASSEDVITFKSPNGYEWKLKASTWEQMKQKANEQYDHMRQIGSSTPGYSDSVDVTVTKNGVQYQGIALAIKNDNSIRCEVRGALPGGERLTSE